MWFSDAAIEGWLAAPRTTPGGQPWYSPLAILTALTTNDVDDGTQVGPLLDQVTAPVASFTADGAYVQEGVAAAVTGRHPQVAIIMPPRSTAVPSETAEHAPTQRDCHLHYITEHGRTAFQKASGFTM